MVEVFVVCYLVQFTILTVTQKQVESMEVEGLVCAPSMFGDCLSSPRRVGEAIVKYLVKCKADLLILDDGGMNDVQR